MNPSRQLTTVGGVTRRTSRPGLEGVEGVPDAAAVSDITGWAATYEANADRLVKLATFLVGADTAVDLVQDSVARAVQSPRWALVVDQGAYLTRVLVNEAHRLVGRDTRRRDRELNTAVAERIDAYGGDEDVRAAVKTLSTQQRAVVFCIYWEDLSIAGVADRLGVSQGTVRRQLARAKVKLRKVLDG
jgi:RNA polymerase sigma factor (sigma-70 family)